VKKKILIGKNKTIEPEVRIGVRPSRALGHSQLFIGSDAYLRSGTILYLGSTIGHHLQTGHYAIIREENQIGNNFSLWSHSIIDYGCKIGHNVKVHCNCYVAQYTTLEDNVFLAPGVTIANDPHPGTPHYQSCMKGPILKKGCQIGCNVTILPHVIIGQNALIGAGSVVTTDIPPYSVAYGNPAKVYKSINQLVCNIKNHKPYDFLFER
jgi:acetyltransferase-like isoleucine patch superfamily enzyme